MKVHMIQAPPRLDCAATLRFVLVETRKNVANSSCVH